MAEFYNMPAISPTMELGSLVAWRVAEGESFESSAILAEIGTDKANMEAEIFDEGVMIKHLIGEGDEVPAGFPMAIWGESADEDITELLALFEQKKKELAEGGGKQEEEHREEQEPGSAGETPAPQPAAPSPAPTRQAQEVDLVRRWHDKPIDPSVQEPPGDIGAAALAPGRVLASPLARKLAAEQGVNLSRLRGTGPGGRIVKADVQGAPAGGASMGGASRAPVADEVVTNSPMRKTIAKRLLQSTQSMPVFYLTVDLDVGPMVALRSQLKEALPDVKISYNDIFTKCVAHALRDFPRANVSWSDKAITRHGSADIGIAVALPDGLITPVVRNCAGKSLQEIGAEIRDLASRAKAGKLAPDEYTGNTFTISNLGMMGIEEFTAIINPPASGILAVGSIREEPVVIDGELAVGWRMKVTMSCDHRSIDGATGAEFLQHVRRYVENPILLFV